MRSRRPLSFRSRIALPTILVCMALAASLCGCGEEERTLEAIEDAGTITMITRNNANSYFIYRSRPMGFEYELAEAFCEHLDLELRIITPDWQKMFSALNEHRGDFIAANLTITPARQEEVDFSEPYMDVQQQVVVHRKNRHIDEIGDLDGRTVHVRAETTYEDRLEELNEQEGLMIGIVRHADMPTEELIRMVSKEEIEITVADSNIALLNRKYYPEIRIAFPIEEEQSLGWAVRKGNEELLGKINAFFDEIKKNGLYGKIYERYYGDVHIFDYVDLKKFHARIDSRLPRYKGIIQRAAEKHGFDWRLIAAVVYQESHFNPRARSFTGVKGLMQVTLTTAKEMGISNRLDPEQSVKAGVKYLKKMFSRWEDIPEPHRMKFALASYNIGYGHVRDAQKLARKQGLDPKKWPSLEKTLPLLRLKRYYKQTKYGYARGTEPVRYVERITRYYDILRKEEVRKGELALLSSPAAL